MTPIIRRIDWLRSSFHLGGAILVSLALAACAMRPVPTGQGNTAERITRANQLASEAQAAELSGDKGKAIALYQQAVTTYPDFHPAWNNLGVLLNEKGFPMQAVDAFKRAADISPLDPRPLANIGLIWKENGYAPEAADYFNRALERDDSYLPALRESVWLDVHRDKITEITAARVKRALMLERDPKWVAELRRYKLQIDDRLTQADQQPFLPTPAQAPPAESSRLLPSEPEAPQPQAPLR